MVFNPFFEPFINDQQEEFERDGRRKERHVQSDVGGNPREPLKRAAATLFQQTRDGASAVGAMCVTVDEGDGMTWAAESVRREMEESFPVPGAVHTIRRTLDYNWPVIAQLVGTRHFLRAVTARRLTTAFFAYRKILSLPLMLLYFTLLVAAETAVLFVATELKAAGFVLSVKFVALCIANAAALLTLKSLWPRLTVAEGADDLGKMRKDLDGVADRDEFASLVEELAILLRVAPFPRCFIIDDWEALDVTTRRTFINYFQTYPIGQRGLELWFIFEHHDGERFSVTAADPRNAERAAFRSVRAATLLNLDAAEKKALCEHLGIDVPPFTTVKSIVSNAAEVPRTLAETLTTELGVRKRTEPQREQATVADFLYILSVDTAQGGMAFDRRNLETVFTSKPAAATGERLPAQLAGELLRGSRSTKPEFHANWKVLAALPSVTAVENTSRGESLQVRGEVAAWLDAHASDYWLPSEGVVHTFWALFWYDRIQNDPPQAYAVRMLARHLVASHPHEIANAELQRFACERLFEATLFAIDGCLRTCVFKHVEGLIEAAISLAGARGERGWRRLLRRSWEAYAVLGSAKILNLILDIGRDTYTGAAEGEQEQLDDLQVLFFESISLDSQTRDLLTHDFLRELRLGGARLDALCDYAAVRGAWLATAFAPLAQQSAEAKDSLAGAAIFAARERLPQILRATMARIERRSDSDAALLDIATLSLGVWCATLAFLDDLSLRTAPGEDDSDSSDFLPELGTLPGFAHLRRLIRYASVDGPVQEVLTLLDDAVRLVDERYLRSGGKTHFAGDFVSYAFAQQLCAVSAAAAALTVAHFGEMHDEAAPEVSTRAAAIVQRISEALSYPLTEGQRAIRFEEREVMLRIERLMRLTGLVWERLELEEIRDMSALQRLDYGVRFRELEAERMAELTPFVEGAEVIARQSGFLALLANITVAVWLKKSTELVGNYLANAVEATARERLGVRIRRELLNTLVFDGYDFDQANATLDQWLEEEAAVGSLSRYILALPSSRISSAVMHLVNSAGADDTAERLIAFINGLVPRIGDESVRDTVTAQVELFELQRKTARGEPLHPDLVLAQWAEREDSWMYAAMLRELVSHGYAVPDVVMRSTELIRNAEIEDTVSSWYNLAVALGNHYLRTKRDAPGLQVATHFVGEKIDKWKTRTPAATNAGAYRLLAVANEQMRPIYEREADRWEIVKIKLNHMKRIPMLVDTGRFFLLFKDYCDSMAMYGLPMDLDGHQYVERFRADEAARRAAFAERIAAKSGDPAPVYGQPPRLSGDFLILGHYLFSPPLAGDPTFKNDRERYNELARKHLKRLVEVIVTSDGVPTTIGELIRHYTDRFHPVLAAP
jgi:hypothetical protein